MPHQEYHPQSPSSSKLIDLHSFSPVPVNQKSQRKDPDVKFQGSSTWWTDYERCLTDLIVHWIETKKTFYVQNSHLVVLSQMLLLIY